MNDLIPYFEAAVKFFLSTLLVALVAVGNLAWKITVLLMKICYWTLVTAVVWALLAASVSIPSVQVLGSLGIGIAIALILETLKQKEKE